MGANLHTTTIAGRVAVIRKSYSETTALEF